ncbi:MAG: phosphoribosyltransferase family protein [Planctomycetota bacterium]
MPAVEILSAARAVRRLRAAARTLADEIADALWPTRCWVCGDADCVRRDGDSPFTCAAHAPVLGLDGARCGRCASRLPPGIAGGSICRPCRVRAPAFRAVHAAMDYDAPGARDWLLALKHGGRVDLARPLADLVVATLPPDTAGGEAVLVPVPLHVSRRVERGYDQAAWIAHHLARRGRGRVVPLLRRVRPTLPQGWPLGPDRRGNVRDAFRARARLPPGTHAVLVDDVLTSGATADACARALRRAGAARVEVVVVARA